MTTDTSFFTNEEGSTLLDRFKAILKHVQYFDILVGYFRTSGFFKLYDSFETIEKIRILVGLNADRKTYEIIEASKKSYLDFESHEKTKKNYSIAIQNELENSDDKYEVEIGVRKFIEFLKSGKIELRIYPTENIHAKVYISRFPEGYVDYGRVITGSSNFSESGLVANREFNVELKNKVDVDFALTQFEDLWKDGIDITNVYIETIQKKTWLNNDISPYELYLKFLYEYFKEEINLDNVRDVYLPSNFLTLQYQLEAVTTAKKILDAYNGVFLADVVGLGKTYISALLAQQLVGRILVICPPVLRDYWEDTFREFGVRNFEVESLGKLDKVIKKGKEYDFIFIDEAHRFRNEYTQSYEKLHEICFGKKVILVSATPLNNSVNDIYSQLKLFQRPKKSTIPGVPNLEDYFKHLSSIIKKAKEHGYEQHIETVSSVSKEIRDKIFSHIMVRRTRSDVIKYYSDDMKKNGLSFPEVASPERIVYEFNKEVDFVFSQTITMLKTFTYSRYTPLLYLKKKPSEFELQSQRNIGGFMKAILVKRLESSFYAFRKTLERFVKSYRNFIKMFEQGAVYISKKIDVYDFLDSDNEDALIEYIEEEIVSKYSAEEFEDRFIVDLKKDLNILTKLQEIWQDINIDPKLNKFIYELQSNKILKNNKLIIFTESKETGEYLEKELSVVFGDKVMLYSSSGGINGGKILSAATAQDIIKENYDPAYKNQKNNITILITTDILAEGINLHRANVVLNYDLPWNPTRVLQRIGRVNRVGSQHSTIYIFNFFPTVQSDAEIGLEDNIKAKIQAFHDTLGEDAKYLTDEEQPKSYELFGTTLLKKLSDKKTYEGEDEAERTPLEYLQEIRRIRDEDPKLFSRIKRLPKKARTSREFNINASDALLSFFRKGMLKKFFLAEAQSGNVTELTFFDAAEILKCHRNTERKNLGKDYFYLLERNKTAFQNATAEDIKIAVSKRKGGKSNVDFIVKLLKTNEIKNFEGFTDDDEEYIRLVIRSFQDGIIPKNTSKKIANAIKSTIEKEQKCSPLKILAILKNNIPDKLITQDFTDRGTQSSAKGEIILSEYLICE